MRDGMTDAHAHLHLPRVSTAQSAQGCRLSRCTGDGTPSLCAAMLAQLSSIPSKRHVPIYLHVHTHVHVIVRLAREQSSERTRYVVHKQLAHSVGVAGRCDANFDSK